MDAHLAAGSFIRQLLALEDQSASFNQDKLANISSVNSEHMEGDLGRGKLAVHLLLQVMNETFLILPLVRCLVAKQVDRSDPSNSLQVEPSPDGLYDGTSNEQQYDACFIDWPRVRMVKDRSAPDSMKHRSEFVLSNLLHYREDELHQYHAERNDPSEEVTYSKLPQQFIENNNSSETTILRNSNDIIDYNLFKYCYLSVSSLLSLCGIFINLFIILIVVFRYRQNCSSIFQSNNTGQNNLLISQLTITGLLLASYFLYDNISIQHSPTIKVQLSDKIRYPFQSDEFATSHCLYNEANLPSPLSTFLPPIQFRFNKLACYSHNLDPEFSTHGRMEASQNSFNDDAETFSPSNYEKQSQIVLLLSPNVILTESKPQKSTARWYLENYNSNSNGRRTIDLSESLHSVDMARIYCNDEKTSKRHKRTQESVIENEDETEDDYQILHPQDRLSFFELFALTSIPLIINVIASIHIWTVAALSYDRYSAIAQPLQYLRSIHASKVRSFLIITWTMAILFSLLVPVFLHFNNLLHNKTNANHIKERMMSSKTTMMHSANFKIETDSTEKQNSCSLFKILKNDSTLALDINHLHRLLQDYTTRSQLDLYTSVAWQTRSKTNQLNRGRSYFVEQITSIFIELSSKPGILSLLGESDGGLRIYKTVVLFHSLFTFAAFILMPLLVITVCNISIYRIVKVHERRLSINSGSNITAAASNFHSRRPSYRRDCGNSLNNDIHSENGSMSSLLMAKLTKVGLIKPTNRHEESPNVCCHNSKSDTRGYSNNEKLPDDKNTIEFLDKEDGISSSVINRSKRVLARQDSFHLIAKLNGGSNGENNSNESELRSNDILDHPSKASCPYNNNSVSFGLTEPQRTRIKRKISDQKIGLLMRKDSSISQPDEHCNRNRNDPDSYSCTESPSVFNFDQSKYGSGGFINQLKMAGLSFAGIAIQELSIGVYQKKLIKSTSYSLGNLNSNQQLVNQNEAHDVGQSASRCSVETSSSISPAKRSYVSMNTTSSRKHRTSPSKCSTKILDNESDDVNQSDTHGTFHQHSSHRLPSTLGTKSAAFNIVTWLMISMLIFALPHYLLVTVDQIINLSYGDRFNQLLKRAETGSHDDRLIASSMMIFTALPNDIGAGHLPHVNEAKLGQISSFLLSCLCRILFLGMVPLNGWLYGIRSRSLKTTIRMVLKRYISRRQASIEISHRQRSISSIRSRDSSLANLSTNCQSANYCSNCNFHLTKEGKERIFRRCSSFSGVQRRTQGKSSVNSSMLTGARSSTGNSIESMNKAVRDSKLCVSNAIRFMIDDYSVNKEPVDINLPQSSQEVSLASSLASSSRSLMSSSAYSSQSICYNSATEHYKNGGNERESERQHLKVADSSTKIVDVMNKLDLTNSYVATQDANTDGENTERSLAESSINYTPLSTKSSNISLNQFSGIISNSSKEHLVEKSKRFKRRESSPEYHAHQETQAHSASLNPIKKSNSEFKFMITSADQKHYVIEFNKNAPDETQPLPSDTLRNLEDNDDESVDIRKQFDGWYKYVRRTLVKLLPSTSFRQLINNANDIKRNEEYHESNDCKSSFHSDIQDQCRVSLLRKNSTESTISSQHRSKLYRSRLPGNSPFRKKMRNSMTVNDLSSIEQVNLVINCQCPIHQTVGSGGDRLVGRTVSDQSHSYLKPPNFLKLVFEPNGLGNYSNTSALSPIKECSSNHSYASSQSSLNNSSQLQQQQRERVPSIGECTVETQFIGS